MFKKKYCKKCGKVEVHGKYRYCFKCIIKRGNEASARYRSKNNGQPVILEEKKCKICNTIFMPLNKRKVTCSKICHEENNRMLQRESQKKYLEEQKNNPKIIATIKYKNEEINLKFIRKLGCSGCVFYGNYDKLSCHNEKYEIMQKSCSHRIYKPFNKEELNKLKPYKTKPSKIYNITDYERKDFGTLEVSGIEMKLS
jgi:hypothetical protein